MHDYEIRIVTQDYRTSHAFANSLPSDFAAIRRAHALMRPGQGAEVWRDGECIYANHRGHPLTALPDASTDYQIRVLRDDLQPTLIWNSVHAGDAAAIRAGVRAAGAHALEVWRDTDCIFRAPAAAH